MAEVNERPVVFALSNPDVARGVHGGTGVPLDGRAGGLLEREPVAIRWWWTVGGCCRRRPTTRTSFRGSGWRWWRRGPGGSPRPCCSRRLGRWRSRRTRRLLRGGRALPAAPADPGGVAEDRGGGGARGGGRGAGGARATREPRGVSPGVHVPAGVSGVLARVTLSEAKHETGPGILPRPPGPLRRGGAAPAPSVPRCGGAERLLEQDTRPVSAPVSFSSRTTLKPFLPSAASALVRRWV